MKRTRHSVVVFLLSLVAPCSGALTVLAQAPETEAAAGSTAAPPANASVVDVQRCAGIYDKTRRLACFDAISRGDEPPTAAGFVDRHWDLGGESRLFQPWAHRPNYILPGRWTDSVHEAPFAAAAAGTENPDPNLQAVEAKFQVSFKTKLWDGVLGGPADLWFGYTQQSHFQVYNAAESRPFRETDFEPELILAFPVRHRWGAWSWRMVGAGLVHQSNGRSEPLSRSWNRIYGIAAGERGNVSLQLRGWARVDATDRADDDNPDIEEFVGRAEAIVKWSPGRQVFSFRGRSSLELSGHRGSLQADWFFPIRDRMRGQLQVFTGYGESLIDYNHRQTTVGVGVLLFDPF